MNILTHALASLALVRAAWPRAPKEVWIAALVAGVIPDVDLVSGWFGASAWWRWRGGGTHSLLFIVVIATAIATVYWRMAGDGLREKFSVETTFAVSACAGLLHLAMDLCGWEGAALLWPFSPQRFALDWEPSTDPLVIAILLGALLFPELLHLVNTEIGSRAKRPRGWIGARIGLALVVLYVGSRAYFHGNVLALMDSRTFRGEVPKRVGAFPESLSPITWHGVVETERALHTLTIITGPVESFDPETAETLFKPEPSVALQLAGQSKTGREFLLLARFPKASVEKTSSGTDVELRDLRYEAADETDHEVMAVIQLDSANRVVSEALHWAR